MNGECLVFLPWAPPGGRLCDSGQAQPPLDVHREALFTESFNVVLRGRGFSGSKRMNDVLCSLTVDQKTYGQCLHTHANRECNRSQRDGGLFSTPCLTGANCISINEAAAAASRALARAAVRELLSWCPETNRSSFFLSSAREQRSRYEPRQREDMSLIIYEQIGDGGGQWKTVASLFVSALHAFLLVLVLL